MKWPKEVPVLEADDFYALQLNGPRGTHCLVGWSGCVFGHKDYEVPASIKRAIVSSTREIKPTLLDICPKPISRRIYNINDLCFDRHIVARIWNRAMAKVGYVVGNPECTKAGKLKRV